MIRFIKKLQFVLLAIIISLLSILGKCDFVYASALPDNNLYTVSPSLDVLNGGGSNSYWEGLGKMNFDMFISTLTSFGIYTGITVYEQMYDDYLTEIKANLKNEEWVSKNSYWTEGNVYMYDGVPYYADLLADCTVFQIDPKTYELWQGNKVGNIPAPADAWGTASNYAVKIGSKFMESVKAFADAHTKNNCYYKDINQADSDFYKYYGTYSKFRYLNYKSIDSDSYRLYKGSCFIDGVLACYISGSNRINFAQKVPYSPYYASARLNVGYQVYDFNNKLIADYGKYEIGEYWNDQKSTFGTCNLPIFNTANDMLEYFRTGSLAKCINLENDIRGHIYINPNVSPTVVGGDHYNLGDIKGVNDGIVNAISGAESGGTLNPNIDPTTLPTILPGIIPNNPIAPLPISDPKPYNPPADDPSDDPSDDPADDPSADPDVKPSWWIDYSPFLEKIINLLTQIRDFFILDTNAITEKAFQLRDTAQKKFIFWGDLSAWFGKFKFSNNYDYPCITVDTPKILRTFYDNDVIVLCDFKNFATHLLVVRTLLKALMWVGFGHHILKMLTPKFKIG